MILFEQDISSLQYCQTTLQYCKSTRRDAGGYYFADKNRVKHDLDFRLCNTITNQCIGQSVEIWHKYYVVYKLDCNGDTICDLAKSNAATTVVSIENLSAWLLFSLFSLMGYMIFLRPNDETKE